MNERVGAPAAMVRALRVLVVEAQAPERRKLVTTLAGQPGVEIVGETANPARAVALAASLQPDVVLLTAKLTHARYAEVVAEFRAMAPTAHVLVLTRSEDAETLAAALRAGASGYLERNLDGEFMADALRATVEKGGLFGSRPRADRSTTPALPLSPREQQILTLVAEGWTNKQIARELGVAESTVKIHVQHILRKLKIESRVQAAVYAAENGLALKR